MTFTPDVPGRGAWTLKGGLLPGSPESTSSHGYYRLAAGGETQIGSTYALKKNTHDSYASVWYGVKAIQALVNDATRGDIATDGWYGPDTDKAVRAAQKSIGVVADGIVGQNTMKALLTPMVTAVAKKYSPLSVSILGGIAANESALDPSAVGVNGYDHGLVQINLDAHPDVIEAEAMDPLFALTFAGSSLLAVYKKWNGRTSANPWDIAIAYHNSPALATQWAETGTPPVVSGRSIQIAEYVKRTRSAW